MRWKLSFAFIVLLAVKTICKKSTIRFLGMNITGNPEYIEQCIVIIKPDRESLDVDFSVARDLHPNLRSSLSFSGSLIQKNPTPDFQFDLPICEIINNGMKSKSQIITNSLKNIFKQGTLPAKCPILAGNYTWRGLRPRKEHMPTFALGGNFRLIVRFYTKQDMSDAQSRDVFVDKDGKVTLLTTIIFFTLM